MEIHIHARNLNVNQHLQDYVEKKLNKLDTYLPQIADIKVELAQEHPHSGTEHAVAQLTVRNQRGTILRAEEKKQTDIFVAVVIGGGGKRHTPNPFNGVAATAPQRG